MENTKGNFQGLDFGTGSPSPVKMEVVYVQVRVDTLFKDYVHAFIAEAHRRMPLTAELDGALTEEELLAYAEFLLTQRIKTIEMSCSLWRKLKVLWIPSFIQYVLSTVGEVILRQYGLKFLPKLEQPSAMTFDEAAVISDKISAFEEKLQMVRDAMPRGIEGDVDVMTCAIIDGYIRTREMVSHPSATYVAAFLNATLEKELAFKSLYRIQYDDLEFIRSAMIAGSGGLI